MKTHIRMVGAIALACLISAPAIAQQQFPATAQSTAGQNKDVIPTSDVSNFAFQGATSMTVGTTYPAGRSIGLNCTVAGNVSLTFADASTYVVPVQVGFQTLPFAVTAVNTSGTTATCTYANLK